MIQGDEGNGISHLLLADKDPVMDACAVPIALYFDMTLQSFKLRWKRLQKSNQIKSNLLVTQKYRYHERK